MTQTEALKLARQLISNLRTHSWTTAAAIIGTYLEKDKEQEPVAHCEAGSEFCPVCRAETRSLALAAAVGYVQRNTPALVSIEICNALNHIVDANKMLEALREIGDFAHDKSTGPEVPDALWEIRSMAYGAIVEFKLMEDTTPPQRKPLTDEQIDAVTDAQWAKGVNKPIYAAHRAYARAIEAAHGIKE